MLKNLPLLKDPWATTGFFLRLMTKAEYLEAFKKTSQNWCFSFAPGRIEFLGNHLDYNGGTVLGMAVNAGIYCLGVPHSENHHLGISQDQNQFSLFSESFEDSDFVGNLDEIEKQSGKYGWTNYCLGVLQQLQNCELSPKEGFRLIFTSNLPTSVGLSSSAALELATCLTLLQLAEKNLEKKELVTLCREAENHFVGLPCGILDQGTSAFGKKDQLVYIDCKKEEFSNLALPSDTRVWIFNTGIKHDLVDSLYSTRHEECMEVLQRGQKVYPAKEYLTDFTLEELNSLTLPENLKKRGIHVIEEQTRVSLFREGLIKKLNPEKLGKLLADSHVSSSMHFENSCPELDFLSEMLNRHPNVLGARLTGGGFGGAVMAWTQSKFLQDDAESIVQAYADKFNQTIDWHQFEPSDGAGKENLLDAPPN